MFRQHGGNRVFEAWAAAIASAAITCHQAVVEEVDLGHLLRGAADVLVPRTHDEHDVLLGWEDRITDCLEQAIAEGDIPPSINVRHFAEFFWTGWEDALMKAKLHQTIEPLAQFVQVFFMALPRPDNHSLAQKKP